MKKNIIIVLIAIFCIAIKVNGQQFSEPTYSFSEKKTSYITKTDGTTIEVTLSDLKRKKGQVSEIKVKPIDQKKAIKVKPEEVHYMYLPASGWDKLNKFSNFLSDATKWKSNDIDNEKIKDGYSYFETTEVLQGKKTRKFIMQVLNPDFCAKIKIYDDPFAQETASVGIAGVKLAGGDSKSYYFKKGDGPAVLIEKKQYKKQFSTIWEDAPALIEKYGKDPVWTDLAKHIAEYTLGE
jgi:hypothetical protein